MSRSKLVQRLLGLVAAVALSIGVGATAAVPADAASNVWDRVALCESGGNWKINTGNGYYGGLQFSRSTWRAYGGATYASTANKATKSEQIAIARRTLAGQGPRAWSCGKRAGLTRANGKANSHAIPSSNPGSTKKVTTKKPTKSPTTYTVGKTVKVKRGDTLRKIATRYHVSGGWKGLFALNKSKIKNPNNIRVGQVLRIK